MSRHLLVVCVMLAALALAGGCGDGGRVVDAVDTPSPLPETRGTIGVTGPTETVELIAARTEPIGRIVCWMEGNILFARLETDGGWLLAEAQLTGGLTPAEIPLNPAGNPIVGHFPIKAELDPPVAAHTFEIDLVAEGLADADVLVFAVHADVLLVEDGEIVREEGAWGAGEDIAAIVPADSEKIERPAARKGTEPISATSDGHAWGNWAKYFEVDIRTLRGLLLWNTLGSIEEIENSLVGPDGVIVGELDFVPCVHGNGFRCPPRPGDRNIINNFARFDGLELGPRGCIEFWYHPTWNDWQVGNVVNLFSYGLLEDPANMYLGAGFNDWQNLFNFVLREADYGPLMSRRIVPASTPGWTTAHPFHFAFSWDADEPAVCDRSRMYIDGVELTSSCVFSGDPDFTTFSPEAVFLLGSRNFSGDWDRHHWEGLEGTADNLKIWAFPKSDFSDRFVE